MAKRFEVLPKFLTNQNFWGRACTPYIPSSCTNNLVKQTQFHVNFIALW